MAEKNINTFASGGWYYVECSSRSDVCWICKNLFLHNFNPGGSSCFTDKNEKIYLIPTCDIRIMKPIKEDIR